MGNLFLRKLNKKTVNSYQIFIIILSILPFVVFWKTNKFLYFSLFSMLAVSVHGIYLFGPKILILLGATYFISTIAEVLSLKNYFNVFGIKYSYDLTHPFFSSKINLFGVYPIEVSFAWVLFKYVSFVITLLILSAFSLPLYLMVFLTPLVLVSIDFLVDPVAVNVLHLWTWGSKGKYFGIPYQNFVGWYVVGFITSFLFSLLDLKPITDFDFLYVLPIIMYSLILRNAKSLLGLNKKVGLLGLFPLVFWLILGTISLHLIRISD